MIERISQAFRFLWHPKKYWTEQPMASTSQILLELFLPMAVLGAVACAFNAWREFDYENIEIAFLDGGAYLLVQLISLYLGAFLINEMSSGFGKEKSFARAMHLVAYSFLPVWTVAFITYLIPAIGVIMLLGFYGVILLWHGIMHHMNPPAEKRVSQGGLSILLLCGVYYVVFLMVNVVIRGLYYM